MSNFEVNTVSADSLAPAGARPSANSVMTKLELAFEGLSTSYCRNGILHPCYDQVLLVLNEFHSHKKT